jgi:hypothetical protein
LLFILSSVVPHLESSDEINVWMTGTTDGRVGKLADERRSSWGITPPLTQQVLSVVNLLVSDA